MVYAVNGVLASGVDMVLEKDFVGFALQEMEIHPLMLLIRTLSMNLQTFSPTLHNPSTNHTCVNYVEMTLIMAMIVLYGYRLSISMNQATVAKDSLSMGDEHLSTIPKKELDKFIKSSVEDLVPILSESKDTSGSDSECDLPSCNDFSTINVSEEKSMTFSNPLFDSNDDFTSCDDESLSDEVVPKDNVKIYSNPLFEFDDEYIFSDKNPLFDEVLENNESKDSYVSNLDEIDLLVTPLFDANEDECFDPGGKIDEIDAFLDMDISTDIENGYHNSEGDIIYLEILLIKDTIPNLPPEVFLDRDPRSLEDEPDKDDLKNIVKVFDPGIWEIIFSLTYVKLPFEDCHYLSLTYVIRIFLPYFTYLVDSSLLLSFESEDTIFDLDIPVFSFYSLELVVSHRSGTFMCFNVYRDKAVEYQRTLPNLSIWIARIMKTLVLVVLSIVHSIFNPLHSYIWESDILDLID
ncbi:hypothetical protein Tco_0267074 [Tanacetum coccineum]